jgi:hypothetical protein
VIMHAPRSFLGRARACRGYSPLLAARLKKTWMAGTSPTMTGLGGDGDGRPPRIPRTQSENAR